MSPVIDPTYQPRLWNCEECQAVLGVVLRDSDRVRRLWVLRVQVQADSSLPPDILLRPTSVRREKSGLLPTWRVRAMDSGTVECEYCGSLRAWHVSDEALLILIRQVRGEEDMKEYKRRVGRRTETKGSNT